MTGKCRFAVWSTIFLGIAVLFLGCIYVFNPPALVSVNRNEIDLGKLTPKQELAVSAEIRNWSLQAFRADYVRASCSCSAAALQNRSIAPFKSESLNIAVHAGATPGPYSAEIVVAETSPSKRKVSVKLKGVIDIPLCIVPDKIVFDTKTRTELPIFSNVSVSAPPAHPLLPSDLLCYADNNFVKDTLNKATVHGRGRF